MLYKITLVAILLSAFTICFGCTAQQQVPAMPQFTTKEGKGCARECQLIYAQCNGGCSQMIGLAVKQRKQCLNNCNQVLTDCYSTCE
jgi:hypothetical protein